MNKEVLNIYRDYKPHYVFIHMVQEEIFKSTAREILNSVCPHRQNFFI